MEELENAENREQLRHVRNRFPKGYVVVTFSVIFGLSLLIFGDTLSKIFFPVFVHSDGFGNNIQAIHSNPRYTVLFYVIGGILLAGCLSLLIARYLRTNNSGREQGIIDDNYKIYSELNFTSDKISGISNTIYRLNNQITATNKNSIVNLSIGVFTTLVAIIILITLLFCGYQLTGTVKDLWHYLPRVALSIFIELFAFFFLKLYRKNLEDIKYLGNEMTNYESKLLALQVALLKGIPESLKGVVDGLALTERNFVLKKDETTIDNQRFKLEGDDNAQMLEKITAIIKTGK